MLFFVFVKVFLLFFVFFLLHEIGEEKEVEYKYRIYRFTSFSLIIYDANMLYVMFAASSQRVHQWLRLLFDESSDELITLRRA